MGQLPCLSLHLARHVAARFLLPPQPKGIHPRSECRRLRRTTNLTCALQDTSNFTEWHPTHFLRLAELTVGAEQGPLVRAGWPHVKEGNEEQFLLLPLLVLHPKPAKQRHRIASRLPCRPGLGTQGPHRNAPEDLPVEDPTTILQKNHSRLHIGNLTIPMHVPDVEITHLRKRHHIGAFTTRATVSRLGSSTSSGAEPSTAVGGPGIHQREGQEVHDNLKDMKEMHEFTWILRAQTTHFASWVEIR